MKYIFCLSCFIIIFLSFGLSQNTQNPYGGYIKVYRGNYGPRYLNRDVNLVIYFPKTAQIPDTINFINNGVFNCAKGINSQIKCSDIIKQSYTYNNYNFPIFGGGCSVYAIFDKKYSINSLGINIDSLYKQFSSRSRLYVDDGFKPLQEQSISFKDFPLITVKQGTNKIINLIDTIYSDESKMFFEFGDASLINTAITPKSIKLNPRTGDLNIDAQNLDTGYYTLILSAEENYPLNDSRTYFTFTILVVNKTTPYFKNLPNQFSDSIGIPYFEVSKNKKTINFQTDFIDPTGISNFEISYQSLIPLSKQSEIKATKINDSLVHIDANFSLDTISDYIVEKLPQSISIRVNYSNPSSKLCKEELTSFYITKELVSGTSSETFENELFSIFPNPVSDKFSIGLSQNSVIKSILIYDVMGKLIESNCKVSGNNFEATNLRPGIYYAYIIIDINLSPIIRKFVKI